MKNLLFIPFIVLALLLGLFSQTTFAQESETKTKSSKKIKIKVKSSKDGKEKNFEWNGKDNEEMPESVKKELEALGKDIDIKNFEMNIENSKDGNVILFDSKKDGQTKPKITIKKFNFDDKNENFDQSIKIDMDGIKQEIQKNLKNGQNFYFFSDSARKNCEIKVFGDLKELSKLDELKNFDKIHIFENFEGFENFDGMKEGTTEKTKEVDLGDGKKATITTKRTVVITKDKKKESNNETIADNINIFPNPNDGNFSLQIDSKEKTTARITIINPTGKVVFEHTTKEFSGKYSQQINLKTDNQAGVYIVNIEQNGKITTKKVVIK